MERIFGLRKAHDFKRAIATLGVFDGVHRGHLAILEKTVEWAREIDGSSVVITFDRHPDTVIAARPSETITSLEHRLNLIEKTGVDAAVVLHFDEAMGKVEAKEFVRETLVEGLGAVGVVLGFNARFGRGAKGNAALLEIMGAERGFEVRTVAPLVIDGAPVSSTRIRNLIRAGDLAGAALLLGRSVSLRGTVVHGDKRGRALGFPTANLNLHHEMTPPGGVYVARIRLNGAVKWGLVNIGFRPTFYEEAKKTVEAYIEDFDGRLYGRTIEAELACFVRNEMKFPTAQALSIQIEKDQRLLQSFKSEAGGGQTA